MKVRPIRPDDEPDIVICIPNCGRSNVRFVVRSCAECDCDVQVAPSSVALLKRWPKTRILCLLCASPELGSKNTVLRPTKAQILGDTQRNN